MILNKGRNVNFGGTGDFLEVQEEGAFGEMEHLQ